MRQATTRDRMWSIRWSFTALLAANSACGYAEPLFTPTPKSRIVATFAQKKGPMSTATKACQDDALHRSACMIDLILEDLRASYGGVNGGGISQIKAASSTSSRADSVQSGS